MMIWWWNHKDI